MRWLRNILSSTHPISPDARKLDSDASSLVPRHVHCQHRISLSPDQIGAWVLADNRDGAWHARTYDSEAAMLAACRLLPAGEEIWPLDVNYPEALLNKALPPTERRRIGLAIKRDTGLVFPRFLLAEDRQGAPPQRLDAIPPSPGDTEIWIARQHLDPFTFTPRDWKITRLWPEAAKPCRFDFPKDAPVDEMAAAVLERQSSRASFLFVEDWRHTIRASTAVRLAIAGMAVPALRPGEACVGFIGLDMKRAACFLAADGTLSGWSADRADVADFWTQAALIEIEGCRALTLQALPLRHDVGKLIDPEWIARSTSDAIAATVRDTLPYLKSEERRMPWNPVGFSERDRNAEDGLGQLAQLACLSDPDLMSCSIHLAGILPVHPITGHTRFFPRNIDIVDDALTPQDCQPAKERLALILNLAAADLASWSTDPDERIVIQAEGPGTAHELIEATDEMSRWWTANRSRLPGSWTSVSPWGHPVRSSTIEMLDRDFRA